LSGNSARVPEAIVRNPLAEHSRRLLARRFPSRPARVPLAIPRFHRTGMPFPKR